MLTEPHESTCDERLKRELEFLFGRINYERTTDASYPRHFKLESMRRLLARLDNPQDAYDIVHVAGTKGKGSVCRMIAGALNQSGIRTGVYSSPHIESICERIHVGGQPISTDHLSRVLGELRQVVLELDRLAETEKWRKNSFFEIITAAALRYFQQQGVEQVVLEVGLGGRLDSTNVCQPQLCVITNISIDHTKQLGSTVDRIAREKAGIIKRNVPVISGATAPLAAREIRETSAVCDAPLVELGRDIMVEPLSGETGDLNVHFNTAGSLPGRPDYRMEAVELGSPGLHQIENAALAIAALKMLAGGRTVINETAIRESLRNFSMIGRCEILARQPFIIVDMAHNVASICALTHTLRRVVANGSGRKQRILVFGSSRDKDLSGMLESLLPEFDRAVFTRFVENPRATDPQQLLETACDVAGKSGLTTSLEAAGSPAQVWQRIQAKLNCDDMLCVTGSAFLIAEMRPLITQWLQARSGETRK